MVVAGLAAMACGREPRAAPPPAKDSDVAPSSALPAVLLIGTSLTAGYGLDPHEAWPSRLQEMIDSSGFRFRVVNAGVSGESSADALHRLDWLLSQGVPAVVVVESGANDALRGEPVDSIRANLDAILSRLEALSPRPVIVVVGMEALPNLGRVYGQQFRALFPAVAHAHRAPYLPFLLAGVAGVDSLNQSDGIHPNARGSAIVANNVWHTLRPILDSIQRRPHAGL
jgi:acyl-CoA thioesterase-1